jgi:hypothetical protein
LSKMDNLDYGTMSVNPFLVPLISALHRFLSFEALAGVGYMHKPVPIVEVRRHPPDEFAYLDNDPYVRQSEARTINLDSKGRGGYTKMEEASTDQARSYPHDLGPLSTATTIEVTGEIQTSLYVALEEKLNANMTRRISWLLQSRDVPLTTPSKGSTFSVRLEQITGADGETLRFGAIIRVQLDAGDKGQFVVEGSREVRA